MSESERRQAILDSVPEGYCHCCAITRYDSAEEFRPLVFIGRGGRQGDIPFFACEFCDSPNDGNLGLAELATRSV